MIHSRTFWVLIFSSENKKDGKKEHIINEGGYPKIFSTRAEARKWRNDNYGYIKDRKDLKTEPHGWKMPYVSKAKMELIKEDK